MKITVTLTYRQAMTVALRMKNDAASAGMPSDGRTYLQIAKKMDDALDAAIRAETRRGKR